ncbi:hypothetical protein [Streptomyces sp. SID1034]|uniref:hypothetical protein n=1 Tax=Streptomyces sp. SID1034 TaxID=2690248 RepID=UPI0019296C09|nr:hypothetical protein [Streptomyces sp. SID1034]
MPYALAGHGTQTGCSGVVALPASQREQQCFAGMTQQHGGRCSFAEDTDHWSSGVGIKQLGYRVLEDRGRVVAVLLGVGTSDIDA